MDGTTTSVLLLDVLVLMVNYFIFPETKGYSLEEIAEVVDGPRAIGQASM